jgi:flagellar basal-body rod protein FlgF
MNVSLYQAAAAMNANQRWQEMITENLASASAPGGRKEDVSFSDVEAGRVPGAAGAAGMRYFIPSATASINFQQGQTMPTGNANDLAIDGKAFFEVQMPNGSKAYTRDGEFQFNAQGQLVTKQGYLVMGDGGPIQMDPNNGAPMTVSASGDVSQGDQSKGHLRIMEFTNPGKLTPMTQGLFSANQPGVQPLPSTTSNVRQGYLEGSNTTPTLQMSNLITSMRMFEANQKVITMQDDRMGRVISDLGGQ